MNQENSEYTIAYFQGRWVFILMRYAPQEDSVDIAKESNLCAPLTLRSCDNVLQEISSSITETIDPETLSDKKLRRLCRYNDIPLAWVSKRFKGRKPSNSDADSSKNLKKRKNIPLDAIEFRKFVRALRSIDRQAALIAQIIWFFNRHLDCVVPLEALLRLKVDAVDLEENSSQCINLRYFFNGFSFSLAFSLPTYLWKGVCRKITTRSYTVFSNKKGAPLLVGDLDRIFLRAGKKAGIKRAVTSLALRSDKEHRKKSLLKKMNLSLESDLSDISVSEWEDIQLRIPQLCRKSGRKPKYEPREVFNCILFHLRECVTVQKASESKSIPEDVVESQLRRWCASGTIRDLLSVRKTQ